MYVAILAPPSSGKRVRNPSVAAFPGLSVTPGLKPTVMTVSGPSSNADVLSMVVFAAPTSMMGSANRSSTRSAMASASVAPLMRYPQMERTLLTSMPWSAFSCRRTTSPRTSRIPSPWRGVTSTRVTGMLSTTPFGQCDVIACALCSLRLHFFSIAARNCPVALDFSLATSSGVPVAMICPPRSPPSGPRSITQSQDLTTSR